MLFVQYPKCSTCIKAYKWLESQNVKFESRDIKLNNPTKQELIEWHRLSNLPLKKLFNTSGLLYKEMNLKDKLDTLSDDEKYDLLASNGMLVKRPVLITSSKALFGFKLEEYENIIKKDK